MVAAVAIVAQAMLGMMRSLAPNRKRATITALAAIAILAVPSSFAQVLVIILGGIAGVLLLKAEASHDHTVLPLKIGAQTGAATLTAFFVLLVGLPLLAVADPN
jgi:chromate transporter